MERHEVGFNVFGYFEAASGLGEIARRFTRALRDNGVPCACHTVGTLGTGEQIGLISPAGGPNFISQAGGGTYESDSLEGIEITHAPSYGTNIYFVNADCIRSVKRSLPPDAVRGKKQVGVWFWELERFPEFFEGAFSAIDEIWVFSAFIADMLKRISPVPVRLLPIPVFPEPAAAPATTEKGEFRVFMSFDYASDYHRKNPEAGVKIFRAAFGEDREARLLIKTVSGDRFSCERDRLLEIVGDDSRIEIVDERWSGDEIRSAIANCHVLLSPHRAEGLGLNLIDALVRGKPVLATAYGGNMTYMASVPAFQIAYSMAPVSATLDVYQIDCEWADPDVTNGAEKLNRIRRDYGEALATAIRVKSDLLERHGPADLALEATRLMREMGPPRVPADPARSEYHPLEHLGEAYPSAERGLLCFATVRHDRLEDLLRFLRERLPGARVELLGRFDERLRELTDAAHLVEGTGPLRVGEISDGILSRIRAAACGVAVVPFLNFHGDGYENIFEIAGRLGIRRIIGVGREGDVFVVGDERARPRLRVTDRSMLMKVLA